MTTDPPPGGGSIAPPPQGVPALRAVGLLDYFGDGSSSIVWIGDMLRNLEHTTGRGSGLNRRDMQ